MTGAPWRSDRVGLARARRRRGVFLGSLSSATTLAAGAMLMSLVACTASTEHTIEPYRSNKIQALFLETKATAKCLISGQNDFVQPTRKFTTDGCSSFPDAEWNVDCCVEHDIEYWCGGDAEARRAADAEFGQCVSENKNAFVGWIMETGVRMGGHPFFPTSYRWGYGHSYRMSYPSAVKDD